MPLSEERINRNIVSVNFYLQIHEQFCYDLCSLTKEYQFFFIYFKENILLIIFQFWNWLFFKNQLIEKIICLETFFPLVCMLRL